MWFGLKGQQLLTPALSPQSTGASRARDTVGELVIVRADEDGLAQSGLFFEHPFVIDRHDLDAL